MSESMTPDEENWASWKCDGGPHVDMTAYNNPNNISFVRAVAKAIMTDTEIRPENS